MMVAMAGRMIVATLRGKGRVKLLQHGAILTGNHHPKMFPCNGPTDVRSATESATTVQQEWPWPAHDSQQWNQQTWTETPTPAAWVEATVPPPPGNWNPNKISMEEAIEWAAEETAKHEKAMQDGEEMAEKEIRLNAAKAKAKPSC